MKNIFHRIARQQLRFTVCIVLLALFGITSTAFAQVEYMREIPVPAGATEIISVSQAPYVTDDPGVINALPNISTNTSQFYSLDPLGGVYSEGRYYAPNFKIRSFCHLTWLGKSTADNLEQNIVGSGPTLILVYDGGYIQTYDVKKEQRTNSVNIPMEFEGISSVAARSLNNPISVLSESQHYTVDHLTGAVTLQPLAGVDAATTQFMAYGANGLLYVLDYGNNRIASFDPDNAFAPISSFNLQTGVTTANVQFAIGITGSFYLADGLGGGSYYNSLGEFQGIFTLPGDATTSTYWGESYITTGADGSVYVYDSAYRFQPYQDISVIPEPSTCALTIGTLLGALILRRRRQRAVAALVAVCAITSTAFAQVEYVRELIGTSGIADAEPLMGISQGPFFTSDPYYSNTPTQTIYTQSQVYQVDSATGALYGRWDLR